VQQPCLAVAAQLRRVHLHGVHRRVFRVASDGQPARFRLRQGAGQKQQE
jgi:hypothetical protein